MAIADARDPSKTRSVPGFQYHLVQLWRRVERLPSQGVAAKHINRNEILYRSDRGIGCSRGIRTCELRRHLGRVAAGAEPGFRP